MGGERWHTHDDGGGDDDDDCADDVDDNHKHIGNDNYEGVDGDTGSGGSDC